MSFRPGTVEWVVTGWLTPSRIAMALACGAALAALGAVFA
jgi:hypothetical protein